MARVIKDQAELSGQGAIGAAGRGPEGSLAGTYASDSAGLSGLADAFGRMADRQAATEGEMAGAAAGLDGKPQLTGRSSVYGAAYEMAALRTYADRLDAKQMEGTFAVYQQHKDDPAALAKGLADLKQKMLAEDVLDDPRAKAIFERQYTRSSTIYQREALERADTRARQQAHADATTAATAAGTNLQRLGYASGLDPQASPDLDEELKRHDHIVDRAVETGSMTPVAAAAAKAKMRQDLLEARVKGQYERLPEGERPAFARGLLEDYKAGKGPLTGQDLDFVERLAAGLEHRVKAQAVAQATAANVLEAQAKKIQDLGAAGYDVADDEWKVLETAASRVDGGPAVVARMRQEASVFQAWRNLGPDALERALDQERGKLARGGADELAARRIAAGEKLLKEMRGELGKDPLGWAERTGTVGVAQLDLNDPATMGARVAQAEAVAQHYGVKPVYLRPEDRASLASAQAAGGPAFMASVGSIVAGFGDRAPRVLAEVSDEAPMLARAGALVASGGSAALAEDVATTVQRRADPGYKPPHWKNDKLQVAASDVYGGAFLAAPRERLAAETVARTGFENRMARRGYDAGLATDESLKAYERTLQEAAGATFSPDGTQYGGVASRARTVAGWRMPWGGAEKVVVPPSVRADRFDAVVDAIRDDDLKKLGPVTGGQPLTAAQLQASHLVAVANGRYMVAAGDPAGDDPRYVARADGRPYVLDLNALEGMLRTRVPSAYRGGR
ncbi:hypothetical protein V5F49_11295 [Xanthobacter sp. V3C-3]|uniref:hypothetical protein n=1 Tax=Xanthobacter lutulentifluminis TaxID=3119935 RepID=UPI0037293749